jgi:vitamin B12 transporter
MRFFGVFASLLFLLAAASASELKVKVVDPQSAVVSGARVELSQKDNAAALAVGITSAEGVAVFKNAPSNPSQLTVLAPGFAPETSDLPSAPSGMITVQLRLASAAETVVVTATRTPIPSQDSGANVTTISSEQLDVMNPVAANDLMRFLPGAIVNTAGQRGGLSSLFVEGGESRYNKVIVDGVSINEPGGTFDFGTLPLAEADHLEFLKGAESTLYGTDAMSSVVQVWTRTGSTPTPELRFGADGGNFGTANGYAALSGFHGVFDYNLFGNQFNTSGQGINNDYSDSLQGANVGVKLNDEVSLRLRLRHSNSRSGISDEWNFEGSQIIPPDQFEYARLNDLLGSLDLTINTPSGWQNHFTGFEYSYRTTNADPEPTAGRISPLFGDINFIYDDIAHINRAGFEYQGDYSERSWAHATVGYRFEDENGTVGSVTALDDGQRLDNDIYAQQLLNLGRLTAVVGGRFVHNSAFGNTAVPRVALTLLAFHGGHTFSGTRLRFSYAKGFKEARLEEMFAGLPFSIPNPNLKPERNRSFETGIQQNLFGNKYAFTASYFNNLYTNRIDYGSDPVTFIGQYENVDKSFAQGAEAELQGKIWRQLFLNTSYTYTSAQILDAPFCTPANFCDPRLQNGQPLLRRPKHSATTLLSYLGTKWGANLGASYVGWRTDSDFDGFGIDHSPGYVRIDMGGWYAWTSRIISYVNIENATNKFYEEVVGYPALGVNFRAGMRFRIGGEK